MLILPQNSTDYSKLTGKATTAQKLNNGFYMLYGVDYYMPPLCFQLPKILKHTWEFFTLKINFFINNIISSIYAHRRACLERNCSPHHQWKSKQNPWLTTMQFPKCNICKNEFMSSFITSTKDLICPSDLCSILMPGNNHWETLIQKPWFFKKLQ